MSEPRDDPAVNGVRLIEDLDQLERVTAHDIVLLTSRASAAAPSRRLGSAVKLISARHAAALALGLADAQRISSSASANAARAGMAILGTGGGVELAELALAIARELGAGADAVLLHTFTALRAIEAHPADGTTDSLLTHAGAALGVPVSLVSEQPVDTPARAVSVDGHVQGWITAAEHDAVTQMGVEIVLHALAASIAASRSSELHTQELPHQSREDVLTDLLYATASAELEGAARRARKLGIAIDDWHIAVRLDFEQLADPAGGDERVAHEARSRFSTAVLRAARSGGGGGGGTWHRARSGEAFVLICTYPSDPGPSASRQIVEHMDEVLSTTRVMLTTALVRCGVGTAREGPSGLLGSAGEAKAATITARASRREQYAVAFDSVGLRRALVEWYTSGTAREAAAAVLKPLTALGGVRAERLIQTLHVYLDEQCSLTRTGERLNLHRNAVAYRIRRIFELLDVDQHNPDDLLLLQLACRARELG